ncbi:hypothetical protein PAXINDRAFT_11292 [Paxillus involutus ATCC 200175]|uniref:Uncharacterized protein n=1 Tax=Paxillus involutus ATCC 200175 TaxID=664439 RepID=A0A0C9U8K0_PAXIN|nr:hypothetical protein PAXINDRAFT_11292 [Paxillus involutus ATCC 200175]
MCADALHDPGSQTDTPDSVPPSVQLEGEKIRSLSLYVEADDINETDDDKVEVNHKTQKLPQDPVGTQDGNERCPDGPTEPPDKEEGGRRENSKLRVEGRGSEEVETSKSTAEHVEKRESS